MNSLRWKLGRLATLGHEMWADSAGAPGPLLERSPDPGPTLRSRLTGEQLQIGSRSRHVLDALSNPPSRFVSCHPITETSVASEPGFSRRARGVSRIDEYESIARSKQIGHVLLENVVLHEMQDDVH